MPNSNEPSHNADPITPMSQTSASTNANARPYRSHKVPACDFCRKRRSRCTQEVKDQACLLCRMHGAVCSRAVVGVGSQSGGSGNGGRGSGIGAGAGATAGAKRRRVGDHFRSDSGSGLDRGQGQDRDQSQDRRQQQRRTSTSPARDRDGDRDADYTQRERTHHQPAAPTAGPALTQPETSTQSGHIVGPAMARDAQVLERCMSSMHTANTVSVSYARPNPYSVYSDDTRNPVIYMKVPRQRNLVPSGNGTAGFRQFESMEKVVEPLGVELLGVYFDNIHPAFPILDEKTVCEAYHQDGLPYALACEIYACSLLLWNTSPRIANTGRPVPDIRYMWNLTVSAMNDDFLSPNFSTVLACILDLLGRPITSITYNAVNVGRVVALSQSLGLNRNPATWGLDPRQKSLRIRTWWGILIHDQWASLSHGTPPHIHKAVWDVPLPDSDSLMVNITPGEAISSDARVQGAQSFIALCSLTALLGQILPLIYVLETQSLEASFRSLRRHETALNEWEESLPSWVRPTSPTFERKASGALNLHLSYLAVKLCLSRIALLEIHRSTESPLDEDKMYYRSRCRKAARAVIDFTTNLSIEEKDAFWLPYTAYHFTSAATLTLRCALEAESAETSSECVASAKKLIGFLRRMKSECGWDLADICLGQCEGVVERLGDPSVHSQHASHPPHAGPQAERDNEHVPNSNSNLNSQSQSQAHAHSQIQSLSSNVDPPNPNLSYNHPNQNFAEAAEQTPFGDPSFLQTFMTFGSMPGMIPETPAFPDLWQMPYLDEYGFRGV